MRLSTRTLALLALPAIAHAVTLSDFAPRADQSTLVPACKAVYTADIPGCQPKDFQNPPCSTACVNGMANIAQQVQSDCPNHKGDDVIAAFLAGGGPQRLCPNADQVLAGASGGQSSAQQSTTSAQSSQAPSSTPSSAPPTTPASSATSVPSSMVADTSATSDASTTSSTSAIASSSSSTPITSSTSSAVTSAPTTSMVVDTSAAPTATGAATSTSSSDSSEHTNTNDHSGGGSPFDTAGNMQSGAPSTSPQSLAFVLAAAFAILSLHQ